MDEERKPFRIIGGIVGVVMLILGIILIIYGFSLFGAGSKDIDEEVWFEEREEMSNKSFTASAAGMFLLFIGFVLIAFTQQRRFSKFVATENAPAYEAMGSAMGRGVVSSIKEVDGKYINLGSTQKPKEIIKVKCRTCGHLEREKAKFCSNCGSIL